MKNYALLVQENISYPVTYIIKQNGEKVKENTFLKGVDLTENQIKELYYKGHFEEKPTQEEIDSYLDSLIKKRGGHPNSGAKPKGNILYQRRLRPELVKKMDEYLTKLKEEYGK